VDGANVTDAAVTFPPALLPLFFGVIAFAVESPAQRAAPDRELTSISDVRNLPQAEAARAYPVRLQAIVVFYDYRGKPGLEYHEIMVHDGKAGLFVEYMGGPLHLQSGEKVELRGCTARGQFAPTVKAETISSLGSENLPAARPVTMKDILSGREDCQWVEIEGIVQRQSIAEDRLEMTLNVAGTRVPVSFGNMPQVRPPFRDLAGARVSVRGVVTGLFNEQAQMTSVRLFFCPSLDFLEVKRPPDAEPFSRPVLGFEDALGDAVGGAENDTRLKVAGVVTFQWRGHGVFLTDGFRGLMVKCAEAQDVAIGDAVEAVGFREPGKYRAFLQDGLLRRTGGAGPLTAARNIDAATALSGAFEGSLVNLRAQFVERMHASDEEVLLFDAGGTSFTARLHTGAHTLGSVLHPGDAVDVTGICTGEDLLGDFGKRGWQPGPFQILLRTPGDVSPISWWTRARLLTLVAASLGVLVLSLAWVGALRRRVQAQTAVIQKQVQQTAALEERNRIARELHDTLAQGFAGTAFALEGIATNLDPEDRRLRPQIEMALRMVRHSLSEARRSVMNLRADALESRDLASALDETARKLIAGQEIELRTQIQPLTASLPPAVENNIFRIGVEAVTNALRHGKPHVIEVRLQSENASVELRVRDDGAGFDPANLSETGHFGVIGMRERARQMKADLEITTAPGSGCEVRLVVRYPRSAEETPAAKPKL
jgi:signal transduction histidine kinase